MKEVSIKVSFDTTEADELEKKFSHLRELILEAKSLADELASSCSEIDLTVEI